MIRQSFIHFSNFKHPAVLFFFLIETKLYNRLTLTVIRQLFIHFSNFKHPAVFFFWLRQLYDNHSYISVTCARARARTHARTHTQIISWGGWKCWKPELTLRVFPGMNTKSLQRTFSRKTYFWYSTSGIKSKESHDARSLDFCCKAIKLHCEINTNPRKQVFCPFHPKY